MFGDCFMGSCDPVDLHTRQAEYYARQTRIYTAIVTSSVLSLILAYFVFRAWRRRAKQRAAVAAERAAEEAERLAAEQLEMQRERERLEQEEAEADLENALPEYKAAPNEGELRLHYTAAKTESIPAQDIEMQPMGTAESTTAMTEERPVTAPHTAPSDATL
ncbi:hypothetical protein RI367_005861 [Sorochytrium milnesiophthora]